MKKAHLNSFLNRDFDLLDEKNDRLLLIIICTAIYIAYANVFHPFNVDNWRRDSGIAQFIRLSSYGMVTGSVIFFTQFLIREVFHIHHLKVKTYFLLLLVEISIMSMVFVFIYDRVAGDFFNDFLYSFRYTILGMSVPYVLTLLIISNRKKRIESNKFDELNLKVNKDLISFKDENQNVKIVINNVDLLFLESSDNYVSIHYLNGGKVNGYLLRNNLKKLEEEPLPENIIRCHRSYMINVLNIEYIRKHGRTYKIKLKGVESLIQVSQKYKPLFQEILS